MKYFCIMMKSPCNGRFRVSSRLLARFREKLECIHSTGNEITRYPHWLTRFAMSREFNSLCGHRYGHSRRLWQSLFLRKGWLECVFSPRLLTPNLIGHVVHKTPITRRNSISIPTCRIVTKILHSILPSHGHFFDCRVTIRPSTSRIDQTSASWIQ